MEFGKRIQKKRKGLGLTAEQLAELAECSAGRIHQFEAGIIPSKTDKGALARVKRILKVRVRGSVSAKKPAKVTRNRVVPADTALLAAVKAMHLEVSRLGRAISKLTAKVSVPDRMIREAKPEPAAPTPETLAA